MLNQVINFMLRFRPVREAVESKTIPNRKPPLDTVKTRSDADDLAIEYMSLTGEKLTAPRRALVAAFSPDTLAEARNRGFRAR